MTDQVAYTYRHLLEPSAAYVETRSHTRKYLSQILRRPSALLKFLSSVKIAKRF